MELGLQHGYIGRHEWDLSIEQASSKKHLIASPLLQLIMAVDADLIIAAGVSHNCYSTTNHALY